MRARAAATTALCVVAAGAAAGGAAFAWRERATSRAWTAFAVCLVGDPLAPGEEVGARLEGIDFAEPPHRAKHVGTMPQPLPAEGWPQRCATHAEALADSRWVRSARPLLAAEAGDATERLRVGELPVATIESMFQAAAGVPWSPVAAGGVARPHAPLVPLLSDWESGGIEGWTELLRQGIDVQPRGSVVVVGNAEICTFHGEGQRPLARLRCVPFAEPRPSSALLVDGDGAADRPLLHARYADHSAIVPAGGGDPVARVAAGTNALGATAVHFGPGASVTLIDEVDARPRKAGKELEAPLEPRAVRIVDGAPAGEQRLHVPRGQARVVAGHVLAWDAADLVARRIVGTAEVLGPPVRIGSGGEHLEVRSCRGDEAYVVLISRDAPGKGRVDELYFVRGDRVSPPVAVDLSVPPAPGAARRGAQEGSRGAVTLGCSGAEARLAWATSRLGPDGHEAHLLSHLRCTAAGCARREVSVGDLGVMRWFYGMNLTEDPDGLGSPMVIDLGERTLIAWDSSGAVRYRLAPLEALGAAQDGLLVKTTNDPARGIKWSYAKVFTRGDAALIQLEQYEKPYKRHFVRADGSGAISVVVPERGP